MLKDRQVRQLFRYFELGMTLRDAALRSGMDEKSARKYRREWKLPCDLKGDRYWRTREDPFSDVWGEIEEKLVISSELQAKTLFEWLCEQYPGRFSAGQLRTLQRRIKVWRALAGPAREIFFPQVHEPGRLGACDFTRMRSLQITIHGQLFDHMFFHFVLTYSNWEAVSLCYSESWESFSAGLQSVLWELGGVPMRNRTDCLTAAVNKENNVETFTVAYRALLRHYNLEAERIQPKHANENGDVEQSHYRFKEAVLQALLLRGSRDFLSIEEYLKFIREILRRRNAPRQKRLEEERRVLRPLPATKLDTCKRFVVPVSRSSTIRVQHNTYSVHSRLRGENVHVRVFAEHLEIWYAQTLVEKLPRLRGEKRHRIDYRHIIDWLVRKPGAFENYRYKADLFPTSHFRIAYDALREHRPGLAVKEYLAILKLAAHESETAVNNCLSALLAEELIPTAAAVTGKLRDNLQENSAPQIEVPPPVLAEYDHLLSNTSTGEISHEQLIESQID